MKQVPQVQAFTKERGVALIMVLLAMALVVMLTAGMTQQQSIRVFKAGHYLAQQQGVNIALGTEDIARESLFRDYEEDKENNSMVDDSRELWAMHSLVFPIDDNGVAQVQIDGLGGRINLNDLVTADGQVNTLTKERLQRLFLVLDVNSESVDALIDWIDENDQSISASGAEDGQYLSAEQGYRAGNQPFASVTELALIEGVGYEGYELLKGHVSALPASGLGINVNTATEPVLRSLVEGLSANEANGIWKELQEEPLDDLRDFLARDEFAGKGLTTAGLTLQTRFFEVVSRITYDNRVVNLVSTVFRNPEGEIRTVRRDTGRKNRVEKEPFNIPEG